MSSRPEDLAAFSNKVLVHEAEVWCPFWMNCVKGACKVRSYSELNIKELNSIASITSVAVRGRNREMSAVAYRISAVLFHSDVKHEDLRVLNRLGICMSPDMIVEFQKSKAHPNVLPELDHQQEDVEEGSTQEDYVFNYHQAKLTFGLILFEFDDALKEGDGERLHDLYKFALLLYKAYHKTKYAYVVLLNLVKV